MHSTLRIFNPLTLSAINTRAIYFYLSFIGSFNHHICYHSIRLLSHIAPEMSENQENSLFDELFEQETQSSNQESTNNESALIDKTNQGAPKKPRFKYKIFAEVFERVWVNKTAKITCKECGWSVSTNRQEIIALHASTCTLLSTETRTRSGLILEDIKAQKPIQISASKEDTIRLIKILTRHNVPLNLFSDLEFKNLMDRRCGWKLPGRKIVSEKYIPHLAKRCDENFDKKVKSSANFSMTIEFDHWSDIINRSILAVLASFPDGSSHLISLEDVSLLSHSAESIKKSILISLSSIEAKKINSFISDSASSCRLAKQKLIGIPEFSHVIGTRCLAHCINLIGNRITTESSLKQVVSWANKIARYLTQSISISASLRDSGIQKVSAATPTRWYSTVSMLEKLLINRDDLIVAIEKCKSKDAAILDKLRDDLFWQEVFAALKVLKPLNSCIAVSERSDSTIGETVKSLLEFARALFSCDWSDKLIITSVEAFLTYFNVEKLGREELGLMIASYCLERRFSQGYLTNESRILVFKSLIQLALSSGYSMEVIERDLEIEFDHYMEQTGLYAMNQADHQSSSDWWNQRPQGLLTSLAKRLINLSSSSANVERLFSMLKIIQAPVRTNYSLETLENIAKIKTSLAEDLNEMNFEEMSELELESSPSQQPRGRKRAQTRCKSIEMDVEYHRPKPELLSDIVFRKHFESFISLIDFNKPITSASTSQSVENREEITVDEIIRRYSDKIMG